MWVLEGVTSDWATAAVNLSSARSSSAGLLLGDQLVCMGGWGEEVGWRAGSVAGRCAMGLAGWSFHWGGGRVPVIDTRAAATWL